MSIDPESAIEAVRRTQAAIDSIQGKTVTVNVDLRLRRDDETVTAYIDRLAYWRDVMTQKGRLDEARLIQRYIDRVIGSD